jgi:hypothetical protein
MASLHNLDAKNVTRYSSATTEFFGERQIFGRYFYLVGEPGRTRTSNPLIKSSIPLLCTVLDRTGCVGTDGLNRASRLAYTSPSLQVPATVSATLWLEGMPDFPSLVWQRPARLRRLGDGSSVA